MAPNVGHDRAVRHWAIRTLRSTMDMRPQALALEVVAMRALVVYESMYGNTKEIATAVADGVSRRMPVQLVEVGAAPTAIADDIALLVVGAPTHGHGMSKDAISQVGRRAHHHRRAARHLPRGRAPRVAREPRSGRWPSARRSRR